MTFLTIDYQLKELCLNDYDVLDRVVKYISEKYPNLNDNKTNNIRYRNYVLSRQICHYVCKTYTNLPIKYIGYKIGNKNHSTVLHSVKSITNLINTGKQFKKQLFSIITELKLMNIIQKK